MKCNVFVREHHRFSACRLFEAPIAHLVPLERGPPVLGEAPLAAEHDSLAPLAQLDLDLPGSWPPTPLASKLDILFTAARRRHRGI